MGIQNTDPVNMINFCIYSGELNLFQKCKIRKLLSVIRNNS